MNAIVFEHVPVSELPADWRAKLAQTPGATVTVPVEAEEQQGAEPDADPVFGMRRDCEGMADVAACVRGVRADRLNSDTPAGD